MSHDQTSSLKKNEKTYFRNTILGPSVSTLQDPLASGSRKGAKSILDVSKKMSSNIVRNAYDSIKNRYYNASIETGDDDMSDDDDSLL